MDGDAGTGLVSGYSVAVDKVVEVRSTLDRDIAIAATVAPAIVHDVVSYGGMTGFDVYGLMVFAIRYLAHGVVQNVDVFAESKDSMNTGILISIRVGTDRPSNEVFEIIVDHVNISCRISIGIVTDFYREGAFRIRMGDEVYEAIV